MPYQSGSGDASGYNPTMKISNSKLTLTSDEAVFCEVPTAVDAYVTLDNDVITAPSGVLAYVHTNSNWSNSNEKQLFLSLKNGTYTGALNHDATGNISVSLDANTVWQGTINSDNNTNTDADTVVVNGTWIMDGASYPDVLIINAGGKVYTNGYTLSYTSLTNNGTLNTTSTGVTGIDEVATKAKSTNGKVYRIDPETIVKAYINQDSLPDIKRERELARKAFVMGVPTAISYDVVRLKEGGYGSVFELLQATGLNKILASGEKTLDEVARMSINLLKIIHSCEVEPGTLPDMKQEVLSWVEFDRPYLTEDQYGKLLGLVSAIPDDNHLLHGDYHMKNVLYQDGECLLIDMDTLCHGNPVFELAQMYNGYCGFSYLDHNISMKFYGVSHEIVSAFWKKSLSLYLGTEDEKKIDAVEKKAMVIGFTRILRRAVRKMKPGSEEQTATMDNARKILAQLLEEVDSLAV